MTFVFGRRAVCRLQQNVTSVCDRRPLTHVIPLTWNAARKFRINRAAGSNSSLTILTTAHTEDNVRLFKVLKNYCMQSTRSGVSLRSGTAGKKLNLINYLHGLYALAHLNAKFQRYRIVVIS